MSELCHSSDVLVICAAAAAKHLIGAAEIAALPVQALLVNVARAGLVDTQALIDRLKTGDLQACIDVFDQEPLPADAELRSLENAWLTPHRAGGILASGEVILQQLRSDLEKVLAGEPARFGFSEEQLSRLDG